VTGGALPATAGDSFQGLGFLDPADPFRASQALYVSADGSTAVGISTFDASRNPEAVRWSGGVIMGLGFLDPADPVHASEALAVSAYGNIVVGASTFDAGGNGEAFRWQGGAMTGLGFLDPADPGRASFAFGVSQDGSVVVGYSTFDASGNAEAVRWNGRTITGLGFLDPGDSNRASVAFDGSVDGATAVGFSTYDKAGDVEAVRWNGTTMTALGFLDPADPVHASEAFYVSAYGSAAVGWSTFDKGGNHEAVRWSGGKITALGFLDPRDPGRTSEALGVSADGSTVVGFSTFNKSGSDMAFRWTGATGMKSVAGLLKAGGVNLTGWQLQEANGVSGSGMTIVGSGVDPANFTEAWIARLGTEPGLITPAAIDASIASLDNVTEAASDRFSSLLFGEADFAEHNSCGKSAAPYCVFALGAANDGSGETGVFGAAFDPVPGLTVGLGGGYGAAEQDLIQGGKANLHFPTAVAYLSHTPISGPQFIAAGGVSTIDADIDRGYMNGSGSSISSGSTKGDNYGALARFGWAFQPAAPMTVIPFGEYDVTETHLDGYTETGGAFPATIGAMDETSQSTRLGSEWRYAIDRAVSLWSSLDWAHRFGAAAPSISASLTGLFAVSTPAVTSGRDWLEAAAGITAPIGGKATINAGILVAAFSKTAPSVQGDIGLGTHF
jgi:probable HAF family extracellular repeat protein